MFNINRKSDFLNSFFAKKNKKIASKNNKKSDNNGGISTKEKALSLFSKFEKSDKIKSGYVAEFIKRINNNEDPKTVVGEFFSGLNSAKISKTASCRISKNEFKYRVMYGNFIQIGSNDDLYQEIETDNFWVVEGNIVKRLFKEKDGIALL
jgi:outer membrane receptor for monomeric catechols